jgi:hypothetical protein
MRETITAALKAATKAQDKRRISTLRLVSAAIKDRDIAARGLGKGEATDAELLELFAKMINIVLRRRHRPKSKSFLRKNPAAAGHASVCLAPQHSPATALQYEFCNAAPN